MIFFFFFFFLIFFINRKEALSTTLFILFNKLFGMGQFPKEWSDGFIIPLYKKGSINDSFKYIRETFLLSNKQ